MLKLNLLVFIMVIVNVNLLGLLEYCLDYESVYFKLYLFFLIEYVWC